MQHALLDMYAAFGTPQTVSALDQEGLRDGESIVCDYLEHGEVRIAFDLHDRRARDHIVARFPSPLDGCRTIPWLF